MKKTVLLLAVLLAFTTSCKKTAESEQKAWDRNVKTLKQLTYEYPSFKSLIEEQIKTATVTMDAAKAISDEKAKTQKMAQANSELMTKFIRNLKKVKSFTAIIKAKTIKLRGYNLPYPENMGANRAIAEGDRAITEAEARLKAPVASKMDAEALSSLAVSKLRSAKKGLESIISQVKKKKKEEKKKLKEAKHSQEKSMSTGGHDTHKPAAVEKPIKCQYCGTMSPPSAKNCKSCGAPLSKK